MNLQELIAVRRTGRSLRDLARDSGMSKATWQTYAVPRPTAGRRVPNRATIYALAKGLDVDVLTVWRSIGVSMGVIDDDPRRPALYDALPSREVLDRLSPEQVTAVVQLIHLLADDPAIPGQRPAAQRRGTPAGAPPLAVAGAS